MNHSSMTDFILEGLTKCPELQVPLFILFLVIYVITVVGNLGMILLITISSQLHSPMYYFLSHLSFIDLCYSSVITPKMLVNFVSEKNIISFLECMIQLYFFLIFVIAEGYLLTAMAYDRYVAICSPLLYNIVMSQRVCSIMMAVVYSLGFFGATVHTTRMTMLSFCGSHIVSHYFCDILPLLTLSCSSTHINEILLFIIGGINTLAPTLAVIISYAFILTSILRIRSTEGRSKAFGTCSSHILAVGIFFGSITFMYFKPPSSNNMEEEKVSSVFYTTVIPMLNPLIYSLRNKDVKNTLKKVVSGRQNLQRMAMGNHSTAAVFVLVGLTQKQELLLPLFLLFLGIYVVTVVGNLGMILLITVSPLLHTPMYYFLSSLSFVDLCYSTVITPRMLVNFLGKKNLIFYSECVAQFFFFAIFVVAEGYLLTVMAYDRYVAICRPLLYNVIMSSRLCSLLVLVAFILGLLCAIVHTSALIKLNFCKSHIITHYFCDILPLLNLSCSNTHLNELLIFVIGGINTLVPTVAVAISYIFIFYSIIRIKSSEGRSKAFGTCSSHLMAVGIFFGSITFMYLKPSSSTSLEQEKVSSVFYTTVIPMLNPLIYSLRNKDVKKALGRILAIDQRIKHGCDQVIQDLNCCIKPGIGSRLEVYEDHWHKGEEDGSEVGAAGGECSMPALGRSDLQNGAEDAALGGEDEEKAAEGHQAHTDEPHHLQG
ncbi:hypothetical protein U0070_002282 [Myodes glareolus]|uniref:G-protein coupled receptors family 1 profile domain-containing protein n=1 Tax=Myodes glareolus TaxID=447135 RepID=A0AAW0IB04_MYOGA